MGRGGGGRVPDSEAPIEHHSAKNNGDGPCSLGTGSAWRESCCMSPITLKRIVWCRIIVIFSSISA